jgi:hypothetical protein
MSQQLDFGSTDDKSLNIVRRQDIYLEKIISDTCLLVYLLFNLRQGIVNSNVLYMVLLNSVNNLFAVRYRLSTLAFTACTLGQTCESTTEFLVSWPRTKVNTEYRSVSTIRTLISSTVKRVF